MHINRLFFLFVTIVILFFYNCSNMYVYSTKELIKEKKQPEGYWYYLPQTAIFCKITMCETTQIPGMYHNYATQFLGLKNVPHKEIKTYQIIDTKLQPILLPDTANMYKIVVKNTVWKSNYPDFMFTNTGILSAINMPFIQDTIIPKDLSQKSISFSFDFHNLVFSNNFKEITDTIWQIKEIQNRLQKQIIYQTQLKQKSYEEQAKDAADYISKLRQEKLKLIISEKENYNGSKNLKLMLDNIEKMEKNYLQMFTGIEDTKYIEKTILIIPKITSRQDTIGYFGNNLGWQKKQTTGMYPVTIDYKFANNCTAFQKLNKKMQNNGILKNNIVYRLPKNTEIKIKTNKQAIATYVYPISQFGEILSVPVNENTKVQFDKQTGTIIGIKN